jgi:hypothetical protein
MNCIETLIHEIEELRFRYSLGRISTAEFTKELNKLLKITLQEYQQDAIETYNSGWNACIQHLNIVAEIANTIKK